MVSIASDTTLPWRRSVPGPLLPPLRTARPEASSFVEAPQAPYASRSSKNRCLCRKREIDRERVEREREEREGESRIERDVEKNQNIDEMVSKRKKVSKYITGTLH